MVHVHDPRMRWGLPAAQVVRIVAAADWSAATPIDVLAAIGPLPGVGIHTRRVVVVRDQADREAALLATGTIDVAEVDEADVLPLPDVLTTSSPGISAIVVANDASLSLLVNPSAVIPP
jgi:chemotaxis signal transduction protein